MASASSASASTTAASKYKKLSHREHILELPDTYVGSVETHEEWRWVLSPEGRFIHKKIAFNPGFYKLFDELVVNARDARVRSMTTANPIKHIDICVSFDKESGVLTVSVENDGDGIPIEQHAEHKVYVPELIFGHLLTSGNYDKGEEKIVGGKNGYGAKLVNVFSKKFTVEVRSPGSNGGQKYVQAWTDHMSVCGKPSIRADKGKGFVKVTYTPDLSRFVGFSADDMTNVLKTRTYELAAVCGKDVKVSWNGATVTSNTFEKFIKLFLEEGSTALAYEACGPRWEVAAVLTRNLYSDESSSADDGARSVSFVNGINTAKGGKHVDTVVRQVLTDFCEAAAKKKVPVKPGQIRDAVVFFVNATIVNPAFDSQTKECLTTPSAKFGSVFKSDKLSDGLMKIGLLEEAQAAMEAKSAKDAKKTDGTKKKTLRGFPKLEDALWAGTAKSTDCTLILTEGDSAATSAICGLNVVGRERYGVFPLRGKLLNVKDISQEKFNKNEELTAIKAILGLRQGQKYKDKKELRYGRVMVMADQDHDGSHIKGLLMNLFHTEWPGLMQMGFLCSLATPLLKASRRNEVLSFYSAGEFDRWKAGPGAGGVGWHLKYYKGLGTSTKQEAREWFERLAEIHYDWDEKTDESMSLAFNKKRSDDRKEWLSDYNPHRILDVGAGGRVSYTSFVNEELIHFSNADNLRSLPSIIDGFKPSQRKVLFGCFKRGLRSEVKVAQLAGYVSEHAAYHHGEASLCGTIVGMAQNFVGSNNINLLVPNGQFGSRLMGGKDSASPRYIFTYLEGITDKLFRKEDAGILKHLDDDGMVVEPENYLPIMPMLLINGCVGIGTGFSTDIPPFNPTDILRVLRERLYGRLSTLRIISLKPWWQGFKGDVEAADTGCWITRGKYTVDSETKTMTITELPVGVWTKDYKAFLDEMCTVDKVERTKSLEYAFGDDGTPLLKSFDDLYTDEEVKFVLYFDQDGFEDMKAHPEDFEKRFRLSSLWRTTNMVAFDANSKITKYGSVGQMLEAYYVPRLAAYEMRRLNEIDRCEKDAVEADAKARFIRAVLEGTLDLRRATDSAIVQAMKTHDLPALSHASGQGVKAKETKEDDIDGWDYLLRLRMDRVKASAVEDAEKAAVAALTAVAVLQATTAAQMWLADLDEFEVSLTKMGEVRAAACSTGKRLPSKAVKGKKST
jgi:DNA topoisomerase-2